MRKLGRFWGVWLGSARPSGQTEVKSRQVATLPHCCTTAWNNTTLHQCVEQHHTAPVRVHHTAAPHCVEQHHIILVCSSCRVLSPEIMATISLKESLPVHVMTLWLIVAKGRNRCLGEGSGAVFFSSRERTWPEPYLLTFI